MKTEFNKKFLEIDYPRGRTIEVFRRFHFALKGKNRNFVFYLTQNFQKRKFRPLPRRGKSETPRQSHRGIFLIEISPVLPSKDIDRDVNWYETKVGFKLLHKDKMYAVMRRDNLCIHLQWHADTDDDPLLGGSVIKIFVKDLMPIFNELVERGTVNKEKLRLNTSWNTNEFGFYDLNNNAIFIVEDI